MQENILKVNKALELGEPDNISEDPYTHYTGYQPQTIIDAMNDSLGIDGWGFEDLSNEVNEESTLALAQVKVWIGSVDNFRTAYGQGRVTRGDVGDGRKSAQTDALKKALSYFSVGNRAYLGLLDVKSIAKTPKKITQATTAPKNDNKITPSQQKLIRATYADKKLNGTAMKAILKSKFGITSHADLTKTQASKWIEYILTIDNKPKKTEDFDLDSVMDNFDGSVE